MEQRILNAIRDSAFPMAQVIQGEVQAGLSKRLYIATEMAKALLSNPDICSQIKDLADEEEENLGSKFADLLIDQAYRFADALIMKEDHELYNG